MEKKPRKEIDPAVRLTAKLMDGLIRHNKLEYINLTPREKDVIMMKWRYNLTLAQIAQNQSVSTERARQIYDKAVTKIYFKIESLITNYPDIKHFQEENRKLLEENLVYKKKFEILSDEKRKEFDELDIRFKYIYEIDFSVRTYNALAAAKIDTVNNLLQFNPKTLLTLPNFGLKCLLEVESYLHQHGLRLKR